MEVVPGVRKKVDLGRKGRPGFHQIEGPPEQDPLLAPAARIVLPHEAGSVPRVPFRRRQLALRMREKQGSQEADGQEPGNRHGGNRHQKTVAM